MLCVPTVVVLKQTLDAIGAEQLRKQFQAAARQIAAVGRDVLLALETTDLRVLRRTEMEAAGASTCSTPRASCARARSARPAAGSRRG